MNQMEAQHVDLVRRQSMITERRWGTSQFGGDHSSLMCNICSIYMWILSKIYTHVCNTMSGLEIFLVFSLLAYRIS